MWWIYPKFGLFTIQRPHYQVIIIWSFLPYQYVGIRKKTIQRCKFSRTVPPNKESSVQAHSNIVEFYTNSLRKHNKPFAMP